MDHLPSPGPDLTRLLILKRHEVPPPGFSDYLRGHIMRQIAAERERAAQPWWAHLWEQVTWQRGMVAANALALAGVAVLAVATFQVAHSIANEEFEGQVYSALPVPPKVLSRPPEKASRTALNGPATLIQPLPSSGASAPILAAFVPDPEFEASSSNDVPPWLFATPSVSNPRFILVSDR